MPKWSAAPFAILLCILLLSATRSPPVKIMPLGDSITQGVSRSACYRYYLDSLIRHAGYRFDFVGSLTVPDTNGFDYNHEGHWGWEADRILTGIGGWARTYLPDMVLMHLGTNDILHEAGNRMDVVNRTIGELGAIIDTLRTVNPAVVVFIARVIPSISADERVSFDSLNVGVVGLAAAKTTQTSPVVVVDQNGGFDYTRDLYDSWHPNESGARKMAAKWFAALDSSLKSPVASAETASGSKTGRTTDQSGPVTAIAVKSDHIEWGGERAVDLSGRMLRNSGRSLVAAKTGKTTH
jgi:acyl-CoA thioesterase I